MSCRIPTFALILLVAVVAGQHQFYPQYFQSRPYAARPYYYGGGENNLGPLHNPVSSQNINYNHYYPAAAPNPYFSNQQDQQRFLFGGIITSYLTSTVTTTSTATSTTTCTVSTSSVCSGRRRRSLSEALLGEEPADEIQPTSIVEGTSEIMPAIEEKSSRKERAAQGFYNNHYYHSQPASMLQYYGPNDFVYPSSADSALIGPYQRNFFYHFFTSTTTTSTTITTTVRSTPSCSTSSTFNQC